MSSTGWHGWLDDHEDDEMVPMIVRDGSQLYEFGEQLPGDVQSKAKELQQLIEGIWLPGSESDFEGYVFVMDPGAEADLKTALSDAFGFLQVVRKEVTLEEQAFGDNFSREGDEDEDEDDQGEERNSEMERLKRATAILKAFGKTYELNFSERIICGPVLYLAQSPEDRLALGVIGGRVWT
eukprot:UN1198